ncbi:MAG: stage 0 sporulation family protein [Clostridia bacterium]|nr:stage 0 sporulation family protein [Clostridia bacterium]
MAEVVGIRFKENGKVYYFDPDSKKLAKGEMAIVETVRGIECGEVASANHKVNDSEIVHPLKKILRIANKEDIKILEQNKKKEEEAFSFCQKKVEQLGLDMSLVEVECAFDGSKMIFYFTSDDRVDFRELVKILAGNFRTRIEMRQIGVRDVSKMLGGLGICGRPFCCSQFLDDFHPVSIKMAKEQGLSLNPSKISGTCGRLLCCLKYEQESYEYLAKVTPRVGSVVETREGRGVVTENSLLTGKIKVQLDRRPEAIPTEFHRKDVRILKGAKAPREEAQEDISE